MGLFTVLATGNAAPQSGGGFFSQLASQQTLDTPKPSLLQKDVLNPLASVAKGTAKGVQRDALTIGRAAASVGSKVGTAFNLPGQVAEFATGGKVKAPQLKPAGILNPASPSGQRADAFLADQNTGEKVGDVAAQVAGFFTPTGIEEGLGAAGARVAAPLSKAASAIPKIGPTAAKVVSKIVPVAARAVGAAIDQGGKSLAEGDSKRTAATTAALGAAGPILGATIASPAKYIAKRSQAVNDALNATVSGRKTLEQASNKGTDVASIIGSNDKYVPTIENGKHVSTEAIANVQKDIEPGAKIVRGLVEAENKPVLASTIRQQAIDQLAPLKDQGDVYNRAVAKVDADFTHYQKEYGIGASKEYLPLTKVDDFKKAKYGTVNWNDPEQVTADRAMGRAFKQTIEKNIPDGPIADLNKELGKLYDTQDALEALHGKPVKGGRLGRYFARGIGAHVGGLLGGVPGSIAGTITADKLAEIMQSTSYDNPLVKKAVGELAQGQPDLFKQAASLLKEKQAANASRLALPAPTPTLGGENALGQKIGPDGKVILAPSSESGYRLKTTANITEPITKPKSVVIPSQVPSTDGVVKRLPGKIVDNIKSIPNKDRGMVKVGENDIPAFAPYNTKFLTKYADNVRNKVGNSAAAQREFEQTLRAHELQVPKGEKQRADYINTILESSFNKKMDTKLGRNTIPRAQPKRALPSKSRPKLLNPLTVGAAAGVGGVAAYSALKNKK